MSDAPYRTAADHEADADGPPIDPARPWAVQTWPSKRLCPTCGLTLFAARKSGYRVDGCGTCGGVWLAKADAARMLEERSPIPANLSAVARQRAATSRRVLPGARCPDCTQPLVRTPTSAGPVVDTCASHGTWLDAGELETIARTFAGLILPKEEGPTADPSLDLDEAMKDLRREGAANGVLTAMAKIVLEVLAVRNR